MDKPLKYILYFCLESFLINIYRYLLIKDKKIHRVENFLLPPVSHDSSTADRNYKLV